MKKFFFFFFLSISLAFASPDDQGWFNWATKHISRATHTVKQTGILDTPYWAGRSAIRGAKAALLAATSLSILGLTSGDTNAVLTSYEYRLGIGEHCYANARSCLISHSLLHGLPGRNRDYIVGDADWERYDNALSSWLWNGFRGLMPQLLGPYGDLCFPHEQWYQSPSTYRWSYL